ncbi:MAG TPA: DNA-directed RNA polymerase subunit RpoH/Rpb5 C-terminal domain-containing protein [Candidatus Nanoarchaeia archaeon]|nr:DNA-directed RNA polymerase subunit RpoH/Rpb5 C-terminal domain-containing protein [Candidatus Nanoarchaeia archaeon]
MATRQHALVPKHTKCSEKETKELLERYQITAKELPAILFNDPALEGLNLQVGDVVKVARASPTAKQTAFYRRISHD